MHRDSTEYCPATLVCDTLQLPWEWSFIHGTAKILPGDHVLHLAADVDAVMIDNRFRQLSAPVIQMNNDLWIPLEVVSQLLVTLSEGDLVWDEAAGTLRIIHWEATGEKKSTENRKTILVLDPGHGGKDFGMQLTSGKYEKDVTLQLAVRLKKIVQDRLGAAVILTRTDDSVRSNLQRTVTADTAKATLFISLHIAAARDLAGNAFNCYINTSGKSDGDQTVELMPWNVSPPGVIHESLIRAQKFGEKLAGASMLNKWTIKEMDVKVLKGLAIPGFVVELSEEIKCYGTQTLTENSGIKRVSEALFDGIKAALEMDDKK